MDSAESANAECRYPHALVAGDRASVPESLSASLNRDAAVYEQRGACGEAGRV